MALRKPKADEARSLPSPSAPAEKPQGISVEECVALGQSLVQSGHLDGERLAATLQETNGDLAEFGQLLLTRHGVGRAEYARALATACGIPLGDTRTTEINPESDRRTGLLIEYNPTPKIFSNPDDERTEQYVTGRFG